MKLVVSIVLGPQILCVHLLGWLPCSCVGVRAIGRLLPSALKYDNFLGFSGMKQCQDVKTEHLMYMQIGLFWNSLLI